MIKDPYMVKTVLGDTDLTLEADSGEAFKVWDILIDTPASNYITVKIDKDTVGYFRVGGTLGSHLPFVLGRSKHAHDWKTSATAVGDQTSFAGLVNAGGTEVAAKMIGGLAASATHRRVGELAEVPRVGQKTILGLLRDLGLFHGFPIAEGQKLTITGAKQAGAIQIAEYEIYDPIDIRKTDENGSESKIYTYLNYGNAGASILAAGDNLVATSASPKEFPAFPFGVDVPAKSQIEVLGILASGFAPKENNGTNYSYTKFLKLIKERKTLFDEDLNGLLCLAEFATAFGNMDMVGEGKSLIGNYSSVDAKSPFIFRKPIPFESGEEMNVYWNLVAAGTGINLAIDEHEVCFILRVSRIGE